MDCVADGVGGHRGSRCGGGALLLIQSGPTRLPLLLKHYLCCSVPRRQRRKRRIILTTTEAITAVVDAVSLLEMTTCRSCMLRKTVTEGVDFCQGILFLRFRMKLLVLGCSSQSSVVLRSHAVNRAVIPRYFRRSESLRSFLGFHRHLLSSIFPDMSRLEAEPSEKHPTVSLR